MIIMCRFVYDKYLIDKKTGLYLGDKGDITDILNELDKENRKLRNILKAVLHSVSKDNQKCTLHTYVSDYDYFSKLMMEEFTEDGNESINEEKTMEKKSGVEIHTDRKGHSTYTFNMHPPCHYYDCNKCPYLEYPFCTYERKTR